MSLDRKIKRHGSHVVDGVAIPRDRPKAVKKGTYRRRIADVSHRLVPGRRDDDSYADLGLEADLHHTKGLRLRRAR